LRTKEEIQEKIAYYKADTRLQQPSATIQINAPLALIQLELEARISALEWALFGKDQD